MNSAAEFFISLPVVNQAGVDRLVATGVPALALGNAGPYGDAIKTVRGEIGSDGRFDVSENGVPHLAFLAYDDLGEPFDIVAWLPKSNTVGTLEGRTFALGAEQICSAASYVFDGGLIIHTSVLSWLQAGRRGIFILQPKLAFDNLRDIPAVVAEDRPHGNAIKQMLQPKHLPKILVRKFVKEAA